MESNKDDKYYMGKMKNHFERILDTVNNVSYDDYLNDLDKQDMTMINKYAQLIINNTRCILFKFI